MVRKISAPLAIACVAVLCSSTALATSSATLSPASRAFGVQVVGSASASQTATLTNTGAESIGIVSIAATGDFVTTGNTCTATLAAAANCVIQVVFVPSAIGTRTGSLSVSVSNAAAPTPVALTGVGTVISLFASPSDFGVVPMLASYPGTLYVLNNGSAPVTVFGATVSGTNSSDFVVSGSCGFLAAGGYCALNVTFTPSASGLRTATLNVNDNGGGSPQTVAVSGTGSNPYPNITGTNPTAAYIGGPGFTLTILGTGFMPSSQVYWNTAPRATTYVSSTQITAAILSADVGGCCSPGITVTNPAPGGGTSTWNSFALINPMPALNSISPNNQVAGGPALTLDVFGNSFMQGATVLWNGNVRPTTFIASNQLEAQLSSADVSVAKIAKVSVANPAPGGGVSGHLPFNVTYPATIQIVDLAANDIVWDPYNRLIYASIPGSEGDIGNTITVINPFTGAVGASYFAGSEPNSLALSDNGRYLYSGLDGAGSVQRLVVPGFAPDIAINLGTNYSSPNTAGDLEVKPGDPHTFAVALNGSNVDFFTDTTMLANALTTTFSSMVFANPSTLYGLNYGTISQVSVSSTGGSIVHQASGLIGCGSGIHFDSGLIYSDGGPVVDPATWTRKGTYRVGCGGSVLPSSKVNRVFSLGTSSSFYGGPPPLVSYNLSHFTAIAGINLAGMNGYTSHFIRWWSNGLAFILGINDPSTATTPMVVLVQSPMVLPVSSTTNPVPVATALSPAGVTHGSGNLQLLVNGSGFVPGSMVTWNGLQRSTDYINSTQLRAYISGSDVGTAATAQVKVVSPTPGGGTSAAVTFVIN